MTVISMSYLLEAGVHFGHQKRRWNPKMREYIFTSRDDIYIIDLQKTSKLVEAAYEKLQSIANEGGKVIFVGTKKQAQEAVLENASRVNMYYMNQRWLGGTLTNFKTIRSRIKRLEEIEKMESDGTFELLPKKEVSLLKKEYEKLNKYLCGIREMDKLPQAMIVVDPTVEINAIKEAKILGIPVIGLIDTNGDPDVLDYVIPCNEDAVRSIKLVLNGLTNAIASVNGNEIIDLLSEEDKKKEAKKEAKKQVEEVVVAEEAVVTEEVVENKPVEKVKEAEPVIEDEPQVELETLSVAELKEMAKLRGIKGYSKLKKDELLEVLR